MPQLIHRVHAGLQPIPSHFYPLLLRLVHGTLPLVLRFRTRPWLPAGITQIEVTNGSTLASLYHKFQAGKIRLMLAFRHVEVDDPLCALHLLSRSLPQTARQHGIKLQYPLHAHFLYDRGMPLWGGKWLGWLLSGLGGVAVHRGKPLDWQSLRAARDLLKHGQFPLAVAPEGATNGHSEIIGPLEPGTAQLGFWCTEDLLKAGRPETVWIVPIGLQYRYVTPPWPALDRLMGQLEVDAGLPVQSLSHVAETDRESAYYQRLLRLGEHLLTKMEQFYARFYHRPVPCNQAVSEADHSPEATIGVRLQALLHEALQVAEEFFGLPSKGHVGERCRRLEEAGWTYIYRQDVADPSQLPALDRGLADWVATEASLHLIHMRLAESFVAVTGNYVREKPTIERLAETTLLIFDLMARVRGDQYPKRPRLGYRRVHITIGDPISVSDRWPTYHQNRQAARTAIATLTQDIRQALEKTIS